MFRSHDGISISSNLTQYFVTKFICKHQRLIKVERSKILPGAK